MSQNYYAVAFFPPLALGTKPEASYEEIRDVLSLNLSLSDKKLVAKLQTPTDIRNIRALWLGQPLDSRGNFDEKELAEALLVPDSFSPIVGDFLDRYESDEERIRYFPSLFAALYREAIDESSGFLRSYYRFQREMRLVLTAIRAKQSGRDLAREFQFEDPADPFVAPLLAQKEGTELVLPQEYEALKTIFSENRREPRTLYRQILQFMFSRIEEIEEANDPFSIDRVLGYLAKLAIVESWEQLDDERGRAVLEQVCR